MWGITPLLISYIVKLTPKKWVDQINDSEIEFRQTKLERLLERGQTPIYCDD
jgi:hypothetical protein